VVALGDEELRRRVNEGRESGEPVEGGAVLDRLRTKYTSMASEEGR
jgi:hypothetical protein